MLNRMILAMVGIGMQFGSGVSAAWNGNPSFETPYTDSWFSFTPEQTTNSSAFAGHGAQSLKFDTPDSPGDVPASYTVIDSPHNPTFPGVVYTASVYYYVDQSMKPLENLGIGIFWLKRKDGSNELEFSSIDVGGFTGLTGLETVGAWTRISHTGTVPTDAEFLQVALEVRGDGSAIYFDQVHLNLGAPLMLTQSNGTLTVDFTRGGVLQSTTNLVADTWLDLANGSVTNGHYVLPHTMHTEGFRVRQP